MTGIVIVAVLLLAVLAWRRMSARFELQGQEDLLRARSALSFLSADHGFTCTDALYDSKHFGNILIDHEKASLGIRVVRDRLQWLGDIAITSPKKSDFDLFFLVQHVGRKPDVDALVRLRHLSLDEFVRVLKTALPSILAQFEPERLPGLVAAHEEHKKRLHAELTRAGGQS